MSATSTWLQVAELAVACGLSAVIGLERQVRQKSAGVRTYTVVGMGAALFTLVSKYGFGDVLGPDVTLDPSRVAAQVVSGLGFIGAGIIFVRRDSVRGLTTAASVWLTAAIGTAAGAGLLLLATTATAAYFLAVLALPPLARLLTSRIGPPVTELRVGYLDGRGLLRDVLTVLTRSGFAVTDLSTTRVERGAGEQGEVEVSVRLDGRGDLDATLVELSELDGVRSVATGAGDE